MEGPTKQRKRVIRARLVTRRVFLVSAGLFLVAAGSRYVYCHSTLAEAVPLARLRDQLDPDVACIGRDLVDGYWILEFHGPQATDQKVVDAMPYLTRLPTHTAIDALDYDRSFVVRISNAQITDSGIESLSQLPLVQLVAIDTPIGNGTLAALDTQPRLFRIDLSGTDVAPDIIEGFKKRHPTCTVEFESR